MKKFIPHVISPLFLLLTPGVQAYDTEMSNRIPTVENFELSTSDSFNYLKRFIKLESFPSERWDESFASTESALPVSLKHLRFIDSKLITMSNNQTRTKQLKGLASALMYDRNLSPMKRVSVAGQLPNLREFRPMFYARNYSSNSVSITRQVRQLSLLNQQFERELFRKKNECWVHTGNKVFDCSIGFSKAIQMNTIRSLYQYRPDLHLQLTRKFAEMNGVKGGKLRLPLNKKRK